LGSGGREISFRELRIEVCDGGEESSRASEESWSMPWPGVAWLLAYTKVPRFARDDKGDISDRSDIRNLG